MRQRHTIPKFNRVLIIMILPRFALVNTADEPCRTSRIRQKMSLRCRTYLDSKGILTFFPFPGRHVMPPVRINLPLTELHCQGTLALSVVVILTLLWSYFRQDNHFYSVHIPLRRCFCPSRAPTYHNPFGCPKYR
jgi:hypothetical protein